MMFDTLEPRRLMTATLTAGTSVTTGIRTAGVQKNYAVNLTAGQSFVVAAGDSSSSFTTELIFIAPTGKAIARSVGADGAFIGKVVPVSGTYRVRVRDVSNTHTASVTLTAFFATAASPTIADSDDAATIDSGRRFAATIAPGDLDVWAIPATRGQFLSVNANENSNGDAVGVAALLVAPDGTGVISKESDTGFLIDETASQTGNYYAVVYEPGANATGRYGFSVARTPGSQYAGDADTASPLVSGTPRNGDLPSGDTDVFQVSIGRGDTVNVSVTRTSGTTMAQLVLVDPAGNIVDSSATASGATGTQLSYAAKISGTYSIVLRNGTPDTGGGYRLTYSRS